MKTTPNGRFVVFNAVDLFADLKTSASKDFLEEMARPEAGPWFWMPSDWTAENGWGHRLGRHQPYPHVYCEGSQSEAIAMAAATAFEADLLEQESLKTQDAEPDAFDTLFYKLIDEGAFKCRM